MCERYSYQLSAYADDEVSASERAEIEAHLGVCPECRATVQSLRETITLAALLPEVAPPPDLRAQILARTVHRPGFWPRVQRRLSGRALWQPALAGAGALAALLFALHGAPHTQSPRPHVAARVASGGNSVGRPDFRHGSLMPGKGAVARVEQIPDASPSSGAPAWVDRMQSAWRPFTDYRHPRNGKPRRVSSPAEPSVGLASAELTPSYRAAASAQALAPRNVRPHAGGALEAGVGMKPRAATEAAWIRHSAPPIKGRPEVPVLAAPVSTPDRLASAPPMDPMGSPMGAPVETPRAMERTPVIPSDATSLAARPSNPVAVEFARLAERPSKDRQMAQIVQDLNEAAFSHREVEWKFARLKF